MSDGSERDGSNIQAEGNSIAIGSVNIDGDVRGNITIGHRVGYTPEEVSLLIKQITDSFEPRAFDGRCPYKGLDVFEEEDAELFFGRENLVQDLIERVKASRAVFIAGPSGSGKSSLVRAGLIHALKLGAINEANSDRWLYATLRPGRNPFEALKNAFSRLKSPELGNYFFNNRSKQDILHECAEAALSERRDQRLVLFIDQFEETFTQISKEEERVAFLNLLSHASIIENGRVFILFAIRSDFVSTCASYPRLNMLLNQQFLQIGAMGEGELVSAIAQPALRVGLHIDPDLVAQIINDMQGEPGALPLMQFALKDLFDTQHAQGSMIALTLSDYLQHEGIHKALERHADQAFAGLSEHEQGLAQSVFSGLIEIGRGTQDTRRITPFEDLVPTNATGEEVKAVIQKLENARLITTDENDSNKYTITHETLIDAWPWLKKLVNEHREVIALKNEIVEDAREWEVHGRDPSYLYSGARLALAQEQVDAQKVLLGGLAKLFIEKGIAARNAETRAKELARRRLILGLISGIALFLILAVFGFYQARQARIAEATANANQEEAQKQAATAQYAQATSLSSKATAIANENEAIKQAELAQINALASLALSNKDERPDLALLLSVEAYNRQANYQTLNSLLTTIMAKPQLLGYLVANEPIYSVSFSPDGKKLASGGFFAPLRIWDVETHRLLTTLPLGTDLRGFPSSNFVLFSPRGNLLASANFDRVLLLDVAQDQAYISSVLETGPVSSLSFSMDGNYIVAGSQTENTILLFDLSTHSLITSFHSDGDNEIHSGIPSNVGAQVALSPDGKYLAGSWNTKINVWNIENLKEPRSVAVLDMGDEVVTSLIFSLNSEILASAGFSSSVKLWETKGFNQIGKTFQSGRGTVYDLAFSPNGKTLAADGSGPDPEDKAITLWDVASQTKLETLTAHSRAVLSVDFSPNGAILASGSDDGTIIFWNGSQDESLGGPENLPLGTLIKAAEVVSVSNKFVPSGIDQVVFSQDGNFLATVSGLNAVYLWDVDTHQFVLKYPPPQGETFTRVAFSPNGASFAAGTSRGRMALYDRFTNEILCDVIQAHDDRITALAYSPVDDNILATSSYTTVKIWDLKDCQTINQFSTKNIDRISIPFTADGNLVFTRDGNELFKENALWNIHTGVKIGDLANCYGSHLLLNYSSNIIACDAILDQTGKDPSDNILLFNAETLKPLGQPLTGHQFSISGIEFSPKSRILAASSYDGTLRLWDLDSYQEIGEPIRPSDGVFSIALNPKGTVLAIGNGDGSVILWDIVPDSWRDRACNMVGRNLTRTEWAKYIPDKDYRQSCQQWPLEPEPTATSTSIP